MNFTIPERIYKILTAWCHSELKYSLLKFADPPFHFYKPLNTPHIYQFKLPNEMVRHTFNQSKSFSTFIAKVQEKTFPSPTVASNHQLNSKGSFLQRPRTQSLALCDFSRVEGLLKLFSMSVPWCGANDTKWIQKCGVKVPYTCQYFHHDFTRDPTYFFVDVEWRTLRIANALLFWRRKTKKSYFDGKWSVGWIVRFTVGCDKSASYGIITST